MGSINFELDQRSVFHSSKNEPPARGGRFTINVGRVSDQWDCEGRAKGDLSKASVAKVVGKLQFEVVEAWDSKRGHQKRMAKDMQW